MTLRRVHSRWFVLPLLVMLVVPQGLFGQQPDQLAALKQSLAANAKQLKQYKWVETTVISMKGEEKSRIQKQCFYGPDGKVQKQQLNAPPPEAMPDGVKGKIAAKKKAEITAKMKDATALVQSYVPPDPQRIQAVKIAGNLSMSPTGPNSARLDLRGYSKKGDTLSIGLDTARNALLTVGVQSYLEDEKDAVTLDVTFATLRDGVSYPGSVVLNVPGEKIQVVVQNSGYQRIAGAAPAPAPAKPAAAAKPTSAKPAASGTAGASTSAMDNLVAPIALYPDALVAQMLEASADVATVQKFSGWLKSNAALSGSDLMAAAQKAGFPNAYVALAPFPQVVQTLVDKPDWTRQLGAAYKADPNGVYDAIQRLRAAAYALGNLKTTEQQEVVTETAPSGTQIIVVQPANPQVVYVPVYNTQTVYVQQAPPPGPSSSDVAAAALVGFTVGIIIGASCNHYYYGPYAWHGGGAHYAYERREDYVDYRQDIARDRQDYRQDNAPQRQQTAQQNQAQRQTTAQQNQSTRQTTAQEGQAQRQSQAQTKQSEAQANQANRQSQAQSKQSEAQAKQGEAQAKQGERQSGQGQGQAGASAPSGSGGQRPSQGASTGQAQRPSGGQSTQRQATAGASSSGGGQAAARSGGSGGLSGYQSGASAKAQSARGSSSRSSSRSSGGRSRR